MLTESDQVCQLKERLFYGINKLLCDSVWYFVWQQHSKLLVVARCTESKVVDPIGKTVITQKSTVVANTWKTSELESLKQQVTILKSMITKDPKKGGNNIQHNNNKGQNSKTVVMDPWLIAIPLTAMANDPFPMGKLPIHCNKCKGLGHSWHKCPIKENLLWGEQGGCTLPHHRE